MAVKVSERKYRTAIDKCAVRLNSLSYPSRDKKHEKVSADNFYSVFSKLRRLSCVLNRILIESVLQIRGGIFHGCEEQFLNAMLLKLKVT